MFVAVLKDARHVVYSFANKPTTLKNFPFASSFLINVLLMSKTIT